MAVPCPECGANADLTPDGKYAHCTNCNTVFEPGKEGTSEGFESHPDYKARPPKKDTTNDQNKGESEGQDAGNEGKEGK